MVGNKHVHDGSRGWVWRKREAPQNTTHKLVSRCSSVPELGQPRRCHSGRSTNDSPFSPVAVLINNKKQKGATGTLPE